MQVVKPLREVSFVYGGLTRFLLAKGEEILSVHIFPDHLYLYLAPNVDVRDVPDCLVFGSGFYNVTSRWATFSLYFRYCEPIGDFGLRFYIDHERNKQERVGMIKC